MRVLIENNVKPILMISFTNHSLDNMLGSILDSNITRSVVRLGARCTDERVAPFSIGELERTSNRSRLARHLRGEAQKLKAVEEEMANLLKDFVDSDLQTRSLNTLVKHQYQEHWGSLSTNLPQWIKVLFTIQSRSDNEDEWNTVNRNGKHEVVDYSIFGFWRRGSDLAFLQQPEMMEMHNASRLEVDRTTRSGVDPSSSEINEVTNEDDADSDSDSYGGDLEYEFQWQERLATADQNLYQKGNATANQQGRPLTTPRTRPTHNETSGTKGQTFSLSDLSDVKGFFRALGESSIPQIPTTNRSASDLLNTFDMWGMSLQERQVLSGCWETEDRKSSIEIRKQRIIQKLEEHAYLREKQQSRDEEVKLTLAF